MPLSVAFTLTERTKLMATTVTAGPETRVNTNTANDQALPKVATLLDGSYVVTWYSNNSAQSSAVDRNRFCRFGWFFGAAFQIQDDILNLTGQYNKYGKELTGDLAEGKRTLMLIHLLAVCCRRESVVHSTWAVIYQRSHLTNDIWVR